MQQANQQTSQDMAILPALKSITDEAILATRNGTASTEANPGNDEDKDGFVPANIALEKDYILVSQPPEPTICEHCGKELYARGLISPLVRPLRISLWFPGVCDCSEATKAREEQAAEQERKQRGKERQNRVAAALGGSGIKPRFLNRRFETFVADTPARQKAYQAAKDYAQNFCEHRKAGHGLYITGSYGTGKTHLAVAIVLDLIEGDSGHSVIFRTADDLFQEVKRTFGYGETEEHRVLQRYKTCALLIIDDLGKEQATEWTTAMLYAIINERYECQLPTIITTNFTERELITIESPKGTGKQRICAILSRLHETTTTLVMAWEDWRRK